MNHLVLDMSDPDIAKALKGCDSGDDVEFTVSGKLTIAGDAATVAVTEVKYDGSKSGDEGAGDPDDTDSGDDGEGDKTAPSEEAAEADAGKGDAPPVPGSNPKTPTPPGKNNTKMAPAVAMLIARPGGKKK